MTTTTNRGYSTPATGTQSGVWGSDDLNPNFTAIDKNLGAVASVALSNSNYSLLSSEYVCGTIKFSGTLSANVTVTFPTVAGWWTVINNCTGNFYIRLSCSSGGLKICPPPGECIDVGFDATDAFYRNLPHHIGEYWDFGGSSVPVWVTGCSVPPYLLVDGSTYSAVTYPFLNTVLGTTTLIDQRNKVRIPIGGGLVTSAGSGIDGATRFQSGGAQNVTLDTTQIPAHSHGVTDPGHTHPGFRVNGVDTDFVYDNVGGGGVGGPKAGTPNQFSIRSNTTGISIQNAGGGTFHSNMQPTVTHGITMIRAA